MKNRKKPIIYERVKRKFSKLFAYISANRFDILKRVACGVSVFALACCMAIPFISNNKAYALSKPSDKVGDIHSSLFSSSFVTFTGLSTSSSNINPRGYYIDVSTANSNEIGYATGRSNDDDINRFIGTSIDSFISQYAYENRYYDSTYSDYFITQNFGNPFDYFIGAYRTSNITIINEKSDLLYIPNINMLSDIKVWYETPNININTIENSIPYFSVNDTTLVQVKPSVESTYPSIVQDNLDNHIIPTRVALKLSYSVRNAKGELIDYTLTSYTYDNGYGSSEPYYNSEPATFNSTENIAIINESLQSGIQRDNCYLIENLTLSATIEQMIFDYAWSGSSGGDYLTSLDYNDTKYFTGWTFNSQFVGSEETFGTMYMKIPLYEENYTFVQDRLINANNLLLEPNWVDSQTIYGFWSQFMEIEILPNFRLSYLILIALAFTLLTIFVRFFR